MRWILVTCLVVLGGCGADDDSNGTCAYGGRTYLPGDVFPALDNCNTCSCEAGGVQCTAIFCVVDAGAGSCAPSGSCAVGPPCGDVCCDTGEACVDGVCRCGSNPACGAGDECAAAGPVGQDECGSICCGATGPCPQ